MATTSLSTKMSYLNAKKFVDSIASEQSNLYVYIGRPQPWPNESVPPDANNSLDTEYDVWHDMMSMKRVIAQDTNLGFRKIDWVSGKIFAEYSDKTDLTLADYYAYTDEKKVYKCISNNNGAQSTVKPIHTTNTIAELSDGYKWFYMFTISDSLIRKFAAGSYLPIPSVSVQATVGSIDQLKLVSGGSGYSLSASIGNGTEIPIYVLGDGDENASATCNLVVNSGVVQTATIVNQGSNYPYAPETNIPVMIRQISSTGAIETAFGKAVTGVDGQMLQVEVVIGGSGYVTGPAIIVQSSCYGYAETNSIGTIINVDIATARSGRNFRKASAVIIDTPITPAIVEPIISPFRGHGASPARELLARFVLINLNFAYDEGAGDFTIENNFRRIGLIDNPLNYGTTTIATARTLNAKNTLVVSNITGVFTEDDIIYGQTSGAKGFNVDLINGNELRYIRDDSVSNNIDFIVEPITSASGATATITSIQSPEVEPYSGDILFINNRIAVDRTSNQIETITLVLEY